MSSNPAQAKTTTMALPITAMITASPKLNCRGAERFPSNHGFKREFRRALSSQDESCRGPAF
jgi:hypothetical protein